MTTQEITKRSVAQLAQALEKKDLSSLEVTRAYLDRIDQEDKEIGAYLSVSAERAEQQARAVDEKRMKGEALSPLAGIPAAI